MDPENSSTTPLQISVIEDYLDNSSHTNAERSFLSIKNEPLDIIENISSEDQSQNVLENETFKADEDNGNDNPIVPYKNIIESEIKSENRVQYAHDTTFSDTYGLRNCQNLDDINEIIEAISDDLEYLDDRNSDDVDVTDVEGSSPASQESEDPLDDSLLLQDNTFSCSICSFTTDKKSRLLDHERNHRKTNLPIVQCFYCSQKYTRYLLYSHVLNVHPGQKFQIRDEEVNEVKTITSHKCSRCTFSTNDQEKFNLHIKTHYFSVTSGKSSIGLKNSNCYIPEQTKLTKPVEKSCDPEVALNCSFCSFSTSEEAVLKLHVKTHLEPIKSSNAIGRQILNCRVCSYTCFSSTDMNIHINSHQKNMPIKKCLRCDFKSTPRALLFHMKKCRKKSDLASVGILEGISKKVRINKPSKLHMKSHLLKIASGGASRSSVVGNPHSSLEHTESKRVVGKVCNSESALKCSFCSFSTSWEAVLKLHVKTHLDPIKSLNAIGRQILNCRVCSYTCFSSTDMNIHTNSHQKNLPIKKCLRCDFKSTPRALLFHMKKCRKKSDLTSVGIKKASKIIKTSVKCKTCPFSSTDKLKLKLHMKSHLLKKANGRASRSSVLGNPNSSLEHAESKRVVGKVCNSESALKCSFCAFSTSEKRILNLHVKTHFKLIKCTVTGHRVLICNMCSYTSPRSTDMYEHAKSHKNSTIIKKCLSCDFRSTPKALFFHMKKCRKGKIKGIPTVCSFSTNDKLKLKLHVKKHISKKAVDTAAKSVDLENSDSSFHDQTKLVNHTEKSCDSESVLRCSFCSYSTSVHDVFKQHEKTHMESIKCTNAVGRRTLNCKMCSYSCSVFYSMSIHLNSHQYNQPIKQCLKCEFRSTPKALACHMKNCKSKSARKENLEGMSKEISTDQCSEKITLKYTTSFSTTNKLKLKLHSKKHLFEPVMSINASGRTTYDCKMCSYTCPKYAVIIGHIKSHKSNLPIIKCPNCDFKSTSRVVKFHLRSCKKSVTFKRSTKDVRGEGNIDENPSKSSESDTVNVDLHTLSSDETFATTEDLKSMIQNEHYLKPEILTGPFGYRIYKCRMCSYKCVSFVKARVHINTHKNNFSLEKCPNCNFRSTSRAVKSHSLKCKVTLSSSSVESAKDISSEVRTSHNSVISSESNAITFIGSLSTTDKLNSKVGDGNTSEPKSQFTCPKCTFSTSLRIKLKLHMKRRHSINCRYCSFVTIKKHYYTQHMRSHARNLPIRKCPHCSFKSTVSILRKHVRQCDKEKTNAKNLSAALEEPTTIDQCKSCAVLTDTSQSTYCSHVQNKPESKTNKSFKVSNPLIKGCPHCNFRSTPLALRRHICKKDSSDVSSRIDTSDTSSKEIKKEPGNILDSSLKRSLFRCSECWFFTPLRIKLNLHIKKYHKKANTKCSTKSEEYYKCDDCCYATTNKYNFIRHMKTHLKSKRIIKKCKKCNFKSTSFDLKIHSRTCQGNQTKGNNILSSKDIEDANELTDSVDKNTQDLPQESLSDRDNSFQKNTDIQKFKCFLCSFTSIHKHNLKAHMEASHHSQLTTQDVFREVFKCTVCDFFTLYESKLMRHRKNARHYPSDVPKSNLGRQSDDNASTDHFSQDGDDRNDTILEISSSRTTDQEHGNGTLYKCNTCAFSSLYKNSIKRHAVSHVENEAEWNTKQSVVVAGTKQRSFRQDQSDQESEQSSSSRQNNSSETVEYINTERLSITSPASENTKNDNRKVYKCNICSYTANLKSYLKRHLDSHGILQMPVKQCTKCDFVGTRPVLEKHGPICPNKTKPKELLMCSECSYSSYLPKILKGHVDTHHRKKEIKQKSGPESFKCVYCSFTSFWEYLIERHMNSHTLLKLPIKQCNRCEFRSTPAALTAHMNTCNKKPNVLSDVSANSPPSKKLKLSKSSYVDCLEARSDKGKIKENGKKVSTIECFKIAEEDRRESHSGQAVLSTNRDNDKIEIFRNNRETDNAAVVSPKQSINNSLAVDRDNPPKTAFNCSTCSFSTPLRLKLKLHIEKKHLKN